MGVLFWPTVYRYDKIDRLLVRTNRVTGFTEYFSGGGWNPQRDSRREAKMQRLSKQDVPIEGQGRLESGLFEGKFYNGSREWTVGRLVIRIVAKAKPGTVKWDRKFNVGANIRPLSTGVFLFNVIDEQDADSYEWFIEEIYGYRSEG